MLRSSHAPSSHAPGSPPCPPAGRWWLRIGTAVSWLLFAMTVLTLSLAGVSIIVGDNQAARSLGMVGLVFGITLLLTTLGLVWILCWMVLDRPTSPSPHHSRSHTDAD
jgi:uncharacterized membrane protein